MKVKRINSLAVICVHLFSIGLCMNCLYLWVALLSTIIYICCITYLLYNSDLSLTDVIFAFIYTILLLLTSAVAFHCRDNVSVLMEWLFPIFITLTPFSGFIIFRSIPNWIISFIPFLICFIWFAFQFRNVYYYFKK